MTTRPRLREAHPLATYQPSSNFAPLVAEKAKRVLLRGPNRIGKTYALAELAARRAVEQPGTRGRVVSTTHTHVQTVMGEYLAHFLKPHLDAKHFYVPGLGWNGGRTTRSKVVKLRNGSEIQLLSLDDKPDAHEGVWRHWIILDEPPTLAHFQANQSRLLDTGGQLLIGATMVNRPVKWLRKMVEGGDPSPKSGRTIHSTGWVQYVAQLTEATCPWYTQEQLSEWFDMMRASPWQWAQRVMGDWEGVTEGRRFVLFTEKNVADHPGKGKFRIALAIDHGDVVGRQVCLLIAYRTKPIKFHVIDEYVAEVVVTPEGDVAEIHAMCKRNGVGLVSIDLAVGDTNKVADRTSNFGMNEAMEAEFKRLAGARFRAPFPIDYPDKQPGSRDWGQRCINFACARGELSIDPRCVHLLDTMRNWQGTTKPSTEDGELAHCADALRYGLGATIGLTKPYMKLRFE